MDFPLFHISRLLYIVYSLGTIFCRMLPALVQEGNTGTFNFQYITFRNYIMSYMTEIYLSTGVWPLTPWGWTASATGKPVCHFLSPPENQFLTSCSRLIPSPGPGLQAGTQYANIPRIISTVSVASPLIGW